jgi:hypothetical protein
MVTTTTLIWIGRVGTAVWARARHAQQKNRIGAEAKCRKMLVMNSPADLFALSYELEAKNF